MPKIPIKRKKKKKRPEALLMLPYFYRFFTYVVMYAQNMLAPLSICTLTKCHTHTNTESEHLQEPFYFLTQI